MATIPDAEMDGRFERWRLLQNILDEEIEEEQVEALVDVVVSAASNDAITGPVAGHRGDVQELERLYLPDPEEDKDAITSLWDTISEIHGREGVKMDLRDKPQWPYICCLCRILLHYDFLTKGIVEKAISVVDEASSEDDIPRHDV